MVKLLIKLVFVTNSTYIFVWVGTMLSSKHYGNPFSYITNCLNTIDVPVFTKDEVRTVISPLKISSAGHDSISAFIVKIVNR